MIDARLVEATHDLGQRLGEHARCNSWQVSESSRARRSRCAGDNRRAFSSFSRDALALNAEDRLAGTLRRSDLTYRVMAAFYTHCKKEEYLKSSESPVLTERPSNGPSKLARSPFGQGLIDLQLRDDSIPMRWRMVVACDLRGCRALSLRSPLAMARRAVRRSVRTKSRTDQVAEPSQRQAMRFHLA